MQYETSIAFSGSPATAIETARTQFTVHGFRVDRSSERGLRAIGPGMRNTRQNPIMGVSRITISIADGSIDIAAELGGVEFMQRFLYIFPPALGAVLALVFACIPTFPEGRWAIALIPVLPWLVLSPLLAKSIKARTIRAIDTLAHNMKEAGESGSPAA